MQVKIPAVYMRGGTSKGIFFMENHLPADPSVRDRVILAAYGSPDSNRRQIDGMGGAVSVTSKVAIISVPNDPDFDVNYFFGQVSIDKPLINYGGSCGNILSAVGPFAIDQGLIRAKEPVTSVRIFQVNTKKSIIAEVPVKNGYYNETGDYAIDGVPGTGGKITLRFMAPAGSVTGRLLPTGRVVDTIKISGIGTFEVSIVDAANPLVFVRAEDIGLHGREIEEIDKGNDIKKTLESLRAGAAVMLGLAASAAQATAKVQDVPKVAVVSRPQDYMGASGKQIKAQEIDLTARTMSMGTLHKTYAATGAICTAGAALIPGTVVQSVSGLSAADSELIRIGHPSGILSVGAVLRKDEDGWNYLEARIGRTARRLMEGAVLVPERVFYS